MNIIIIDDDEINNFVCERVIKSISPETEIKCYTSATEALSEISESEHANNAIILLDLNMPKMDGWQFLEEISSKNIECRIFILTSSQNPVDIEAAKNNSLVKKFFSKPLSADNINEILMDI